MALFSSVFARAGNTPSASDFSWELNERGFSVFEHKGHSFIPHPSDGVLDIFNRTPVFEGLEYQEEPPPIVTSSDNKIALAFGWGTVEADYVRVDAGVVIRMKMSNASDTHIERLAVQVVRLTYSAVAQITLDGEVAKPFDGGVWPVFDLADSDRKVTVIYPEGELEVSADSSAQTEGSAGFFFAESEGVTNRIGVVVANIPAGESREATLKLKFK